MTLFFLFNFSSFILIWLFMEVNLVVFVSWMYLYFFQGYASLVGFSQSFYYLIVQSMGSFMFLLSVVNTNFFMEDLVSVMILMSMSLKLGVPPLHIWVYKFCSNVPPMVIPVILGLQKFPFFFLILYFDTQIILFFCLFSLVLGSMSLFSSLEYSQFLVSSSIYFFCWVYLMLVQDFLMGSINILTYFFALSLFCLNLNFYLGNFSFYSKWTFICCGLYFLSLPPFNLFFFKLFTLSSVSLLGSESFFLILWAFTFLSVLGYFKFFYKMVISFWNVHCYSLNMTWYFILLVNGLIFLFF